MTVAWKLATELRGGQTFDAAVAPIVRDYDTFTECMSREPQSSSKRSTVSAKALENKGAGKAFSKLRQAQRPQPYGRGPRASWAQSEPNAARWSSEAKPDWSTQWWGASGPRSGAAGTPNPGHVVDNRPPPRKPKIRLTPNASVQPQGSNVILLSCFDGIGTSAFVLSSLVGKLFMFVAWEIDPECVLVVKKHFPDVAAISWMTGHLM